MIAPASPPPVPRAMDASDVVALAQTEAAQPSRSVQLEATSSPSSAQAAEEGLDRNALSRYRIAVARHIGHRDFSELEQDIGTGRKAVIGVLIGDDGGVMAVKVLRSSGNARVDATALALFDAGARGTPVPEALRGRAFAAEFPVEFEARQVRRDED